ncbi:anti-sigma factor [Aquabacterium sp.]|uniref:anti-sigma factor n=1 Tax=Aquabacterium sp. TaxID=1872578 RepID=UPI00248A7891|nr:anti-sigma factor [Aquabacterium sp.]MDI1261101.1 anti-sigma factor [Aquabacterium sp.]
MDYSRTERADRLAAEYVLGTMSGRARRRFETLLPAHPQLRRSVNEWQERLVPLADVMPEVLPSPQVWQALQRRLFAASADAALAAQGLSGWWQRLAVWRGLTAFATVAALSLGIWLAQPLPVNPPIVIVMAAQPGTPQGLQNASFVVSVAGDGRSLVFKPLAQLPVGLDKALELWALPGQGAPRSLGLVSADGATTVLRQQLLKGTAAFAVSVEPPGGSPTGAPTGPVISVGKLQT